MVIKTVYHFVDSNQEVEISSKERGYQKIRGREGGFGSRSAWEGTSDLPWGRKDFPGGPGVGGELYRLTTK